jgi:ubiquitin C-terminal hydrolase
LLVVYVYVLKFALDTFKKTLRTSTLIITTLFISSNVINSLNYFMYYSTTNRAYVSRNPSVFNSIYLPNAPSAMSSLIQNSPPSLLPRLSRKPSIPGQRQRQLSAVSDDKPKGLANLRNTCYMNSVLQILFQIL